MHTALRILSAPDRFAVSSTTPTIAERIALVALAAGGIAAYGGIAHAAEGGLAMAGGALRALAAGGGAWALSAPALVVLGALGGSSLPWWRSLLLGMITMAFGGGVFLSTLPVVLLMEAVTDAWGLRVGIHLGALVGVGMCATAIFGRTAIALEGKLRGLHVAWMGLFSVLFLELAWLVDLYRFTA